MKPHYESEILEIKYQMEGKKSLEDNYMVYLTYGISLIQNLSLYYASANTEYKQKIFGSIFPDGAMIENKKCRTVRENEIIRVLRGFEYDFTQKNNGRRGANPLSSAYVPRAERL